MLHDLIYDSSEIADLIKKEFPDAVITDATDFIHTERFEIDIPSLTCSDEKFYIFLMRIGAAVTSFTFQLWLYGHNRPQWLNTEWIKTQIDKYNKSHEKTLHNSNG